VNASIKLSWPERREFREVPVVYEDRHLLALDKPSQLLTSPDRYDPDRSNLMRLLHRDIARGAAWAAERGLTYLANAHRLDFETTGILLLAKDRPTLIALADQFGSEKPARTYAALVQGSPPENAFEVDARLAPHPGRPGLMRVDAKLGKKARTRFEVAERFSGYTLLQGRPFTCRTHQIRVHLRHAGYAAVGDACYGGRPLMLSRLKPGYRLKPGQEERPLIGRVALHAERLSVVHPATGESVTIHAPWPNDFKVSVKYLRRFAPGA